MLRIRFKQLSDAVSRCIKYIYLNNGQKYYLTHVASDDVIVPRAVRCILQSQGILSLIRPVGLDKIIQAGKQSSIGTLKVLKL